MFCFTYGRRTRISMLRPDFSLEIKSVIVKRCSDGDGTHILDPSMCVSQSYRADGPYHARATYDRCMTVTRIVTVACTA